MERKDCIIRNINYSDNSFDNRNYKSFETLKQTKWTTKHTLQKAEVRLWKTM